MDGIDMHPGATTDAMDLMDEAGRFMSTHWGAISDRLDLLAGQLGQGELGAAYLAGYQPAAAATAATVESHCQRPGRLAAMGHQCVNTYRSADQRSLDNVNSVGPTLA